MAEPDNKKPESVPLPVAGSAKPGEPAKPATPATPPAAAAPAAAPAAAAAAKPGTPPVLSAAGAPKPATATAAAPAAKAAVVSEEAIDRRTLLQLGPVAVPWVGLAWATFTGAMALSAGALTRFLFPNVLFEPPSSFKAGFPEEYATGKVDERWKNAYGVWLCRTADDLEQHKAGFYALSTVCTHLGCTPNWLEAEDKFKCPCHGSGYRKTGINFEGPAPRPLERFRVVWADDGQLLIDKSKKFQWEKGQWKDPESFLGYS
jgi:cytochrome b6-f complex iron-sulfur subunit